MAVTAEQLNIILAARDREFQRAMDQNTKRIERFARTTNKNLNQTNANFDALGRAAKRLGPLLAGAFSVQQVNALFSYTRELENLSRIAGISVSDFQGMSFGAQKFGIQQDKLADILKDTNDKLGDFFQTGAGPMADFFENIAPKVGVTAEQFKNLSGAQALQLYVNSLEKANVSQAELTFYMEALASDATLLAPLLANNGEEMANLAEQAQNLGIILDDDVIRQTNQMGEVWRSVMSSMTANFRSMAKFVINGFDDIFAITDIGRFNQLEDRYAETLAMISNTQQAINQLAAEPGSIFENFGGIGGVGYTSVEEAEAALVELKLAAENIASEMDAINAANNRIDEARRNINREPMFLKPWTAPSVSGGQRTAGQPSDVSLKRMQQLADDLNISLQDVQSTAMGIESSMESAFMSMIDGTTSAKDAFRSMARDIIAQLYRVLVVQRMVGSFEKDGGGILGAAFSAFTGKASGGSVMAGQPYMTGESGRELFVPSQNGRILSPAQTKALSGGGGEIVVQQTINISTGVQQTVRTEIKSMLPQIAEASKAAVLDARRRGGNFSAAFG